MSILAIDVGTSAVRASVIGPDARIADEHRIEVLPSSPTPGLVEFDASAIARAALETARTVLGRNGDIDAVGITNQRASTVVWDRATGEPVAPGIGWQDLRTVGDCLVLQGEGLRLAPNMSATKLAHLLDAHDSGRERDLCFGTVDSWLAWVLSAGSAHITDLTNAAVTGLIAHDGSGWDRGVLDKLRIPEHVMPTIVDSTGQLATATRLEGSPPITAMLGDQQASLVGQGCAHAGSAKITFGTGAMLDVVVGGARPGFDTRGPSGTFPIVARREAGEITWGIEAIMLAAGTNIEWLRDDLGIISSAAESHDVASSCDDSGGVVFVPALVGLGTPSWDFGARGTFCGISTGVGRAQMVRAVLEGVAHRGADLIEAAEHDSGIELTTLRVDGGMTRNPTFVKALADASQRRIEVSPVVEATGLGAALCAGLEVGTWHDWDEIAATWNPVEVVEPAGSLDRELWRSAVARASGWFPDLSDLEF